MRVILASGSPRRKELLSKIYDEFEIIKAEGDEIISKEAPSEIVEELSNQKAMEVYNRLAEEDNLIVIGADTVVSYNSQILIKPVDEEDSFNTLKLLSGHSHNVYTGVTIIRKVGTNVDIYTFSEETKVYVSPMSDDEIREYIATGEPADKAGSYGIQGLFAKYIEKIEGDYNNVVGFPINKVYQIVKNFNN